MNTRNLAMKAAVAPRPSPRAFTLIELLVVIAIIGILAALILGGLSNAKASARTIVCLGHHRQLAIANHLYQAEHLDRFPEVYHGGFKPVPDARERPWVSGWMDWSATAHNDNTNVALLTETRYAALAPYVAHSASLFKCPADPHLSPAQKAKGWTRRVRSVSANVLLGEGNALSGPLNDPFPHLLYVRCFRSADLLAPGPSETWLYTDEFPSSITDPAFFPPNSPIHFVDVPGNNHRGAGTFAFADGHVETRRWIGPTLRSLAVSLTNLTSNLATRPGDPDLAWLASRNPRR